METSSTLADSHMLDLETLLVEGPFFVSDGAQCPSGWLVSGETCVRLFLQAANFNDAKAKCEDEEGILLDCDQQTVVDDVADILHSLFESGLTESTWLVKESSETMFPRALNRGKDSKYRLIDVPDSAVFPFICLLTQIGRRSLLFQQLLLNKGSPTLTSVVPSEVYFHPRADADFVALPCAADGNPAPYITWFKNDVELAIPSSSNISFLLSGGSLLVPAVSSLAYSSFYCTAKNIYGEVRGPSILLKPAFLDSFRPHRLEVFPLFNGGARLDCDAPAHQPSQSQLLYCLSVLIQLFIYGKVSTTV
uniref:Ig-like domain-containing protein n=1 Tax=Heterorhabditis bacteriophora TaxID=37862 RepID=A0A1I7XS99_HETBA